MLLVRCALTLSISSLAMTCAGRASALDAGAPPFTQVSALDVDVRPAQIRGLVEGTLEPGISPQSLFDVPLSDEAALQIEAKRVRTLLAAVNTAERGAASAVTSSGAAAETSAPTVDALAWSQRLELDRARLTFYSLDAARRAELLNAHAARRETTRPPLESPSSQPADIQREQALAAAKAARLEAERLVSDEVTRLGRLDEQVRSVQSRYEGRRSELVLRRDLIFGWQRRVTEAKAADALAADATYDALQRQLRSSRDELVEALSALGTASDVPTVGATVLNDIPADIATDVARERRLVVERSIVEAQRQEASLREERCSTLLDEITALNRERLGLLPHLTADKRQAVTGFTAAGWEQASAESKHLSLILRYHQHVARRWLSSLRSGKTAEVSPLDAAAFFVPLLGVLLVFGWARRKIDALLELAEERLAAADRNQHRTTQSSARHFFRVMLGVHKPLEWMVLLTVIFELLPPGARELVELQLLSSAVTWLLMGTLVVNVVNALAQGRGDVLASSQGSEALLRLRSLRFVGATVVLFGLTLVLSARLVGEGTIYRWVSTAAWFASIPVFLVLVRWWRGTVFQRLDRVRKKTSLQSWILANRSGWQSFLAAMVGALQLFVTGTLRVARSWASDFDFARRVHAYLFKREIERLGEGLSQLEPLSDATADVLHPERPFPQWIACPADVVREAVEQRCVMERGGVVAVHGARGMGKSSLLRALAQHVGSNATIVECTRATRLGDIRRAVRRSIDDLGPSPVVLLDEAQTLIEARIGGFTRFDEIMAWIRSDGDGITWVFAVDGTLWPLLQRARDSRPLFDESYALPPWQETQIGELLAQRCAQAGVAPTYADLLEQLPAGADDIERQEALDAKRAGYQRMLWDHVGGNPGLALQAWRASLARAANGEVRVRLLQTPELTRLEALPDASLFVLRAVLQLEPAAVDAVAQVTRLRPEEVLVDFRFGKSHGYFEDVAGGVRVAWPWLGAVTRLLERRRLLVVS